jgi:hypothetical protein
MGAVESSQFVEKLPRKLGYGGLNSPGHDTNWFAATA